MGDKPLGELTIIELLNLLDRVSAELRQRQLVYASSFDNQDSFSTGSFERVEPSEQLPLPSRPLRTPWTCGYTCRWCSQACTRKEGHCNHSCYEHRHRR